MDSRIDVFALFGLKLGEVHVLRNAGGVVTDDVVRSLTISQRKLGTGRCCWCSTPVAVWRRSPTTSSPRSWPRPSACGRRGGRTPPPARRSASGATWQLRHDPFLLPETVVRGFVLDVGEFTLHEIH